ncbi:MAG TPA: poly(3-hydroxyalkanoate) polymerase, partial [Blastococcus sp.]|nr:poly(3-hydroxyalkanoate) polymerase [Blastococcus sp.]
MAQPATTARPKKAAKATPKRAAGPAEPPEDATEAVMGLDMLLVDAARGPIRRMIPPVGTTLRFGSSLARQPGTV